MTNSLVLLRDGISIAERVLGAEALEIGSASSCDLVVDEPAIPARAYLVQARGGSVWLTDLLHARLSARVLPLGCPLNLGERHQLVRRHVEGARCDACTTVPIGQEEPLAGCRWTVLVGRGGDARRVTVGERPLRVGKAAHNDLVLRDPTVSAEHCRFELEGRSLMVRDLDSTNGTCVQGVRVGRAQLSAGMQVRVGRTDLLVVARSQDQGAEVDPPPLVATSLAMQLVLAEVRRFAPLSWPMLVLGPSGVGKEELAGLVHREGSRHRGPFVALNAGGLPRELVESELFGHERGAFTGAHGQRRGVFEQAHGGTLFLDEIGELPLSLQSRLLRVLETWRIRRVGGEAELAVDVRLVCATHRDLAAMVHEGTFRQDLYYRLAQLVLQVPALSERPEDILPLAKHFLQRMAHEIGARSLSVAAEARLLAHPWPGNARELRNVLCAAAALSPAPQLEVEDVERAIVRVSGPLVPTQLDAEAVERAMARYGGNLSAASRALSIPRSTLRDRLRRAGQAKKAHEED